MSNSHMPPDFLQPCLFSVEAAVLSVYKSHPALVDKEVGAVYDLLRDFFKKLAQGKELDEPFSTLTRKQALIEAIFEALDQRESVGADEQYLQNPDYSLGGHPIPYLETLYVTVFNYLRRSARFWRKEGGKRGYLHFLRDQMSSLEE